MESLGPVVSSARVHDSLNLPNQNLKTPDHTDSSASTEEKAAIVDKGQQSDGIIKTEKPEIGEVNSTPMVPTIVVEDMGDDEKPQVTAPDAGQTQAVEDDAVAAPGAFQIKPAPIIPEWYTVGWRQASGIDKPPLPEGEEKDNNILQMFIGEQYYGAWYHNAGIIIFAVLATHFLTRFHFGWGWLFIVLAVCNSAYTTSMSRFRRSARDDIQRELVKTRMASEHESAEWINNFLHRFWLIYEPVLSTSITASVNQILSTSTPAFLDSMNLTGFTLGTKAPRIDKVRTFPKTEEDVVMMDWGLSFTPKDTSDMTEKEKANMVNPRIELSVRVGKGLATAALPILVEDISFSGLLRIRMKLGHNFPHIQIVDISFLGKPDISYVLKPLGGDTFGFDIANVPGLSTFIRDMTHATLEPMMYEPNVFTLNLEQMLSGKPLDAAIGVVQVLVRSARGVKATKMGGGAPDPYASLNLEHRAEICHTNYKSNTYNPTWMETKFILVNTLKEVMVLDLYDYNDVRKDTLLGSVEFPLSKLLDDQTHEDIVSTILQEGKDRGELRYDVNYFPVIEAEEGKEEILDSTVGIVRLVIHQAKELDQSKALAGGLNPLCKVRATASITPSFKSPTKKRTNSPVWEVPYEFLCTDKNAAIITVKVIDDCDFLANPVIGYMSINLVDLLPLKDQAGRDWFKLSGCRSGKLRLSAEWKPLSMAGSLHGSDQYMPPIGVVRLVINKAVDVKNVEATLGGKSDPYVRVQVQNVTKGRTEVVNNNLNPVWDQIIYIPVHSLKENLTLECMDYQNLTKDRSLGSVELRVADLATKADNLRYPYLTTGVKAMEAPIELEQGHSYKGTLCYTAEFIPCLALKNIKFERQTTEKDRLASQYDNDRSSLSGSNASEDDDIPAGVTYIPEPTGRPDADATNNVPATATDVNVEPNGNGEPNGVADKKAEIEGVEMDHEELLAQQSGIIVFRIISGHLATKGRLEVLLDDGYWPIMSTPKARKTDAQWDYVGEGFMKEIDFGCIWLRLNEAAEGDSDDIVAEFKLDARTFLQDTLKGPHTYGLNDSEGNNHSSVVVEARYIPVPVTLEPRETVNNQGILRVELLDGREIRGVDRGGKSDPFAVFELNGQRVFKSQTRKKTTSPDWNEHFEVNVSSRYAAEFVVEVFDWNQIETAKSLGIGKIDLSTIEPMQSVERVISLVSTKHGEKGEVRLRLVFRPMIIAKTRKNTSTFTSAGRAMTTIGAMPLSAGLGVFHGVTGVFKHKEHEETAPGFPFGQTAGVSDNHAAVADKAFPSSESGHPVAGEPGTLRVTVLDAKDLVPHDIKPYTTVRVGDKEFKTKHTGKTGTPEWNDSFSFTVSSLTSMVYVWIYDHKTLAKDKEIAEGEVEIWRHIRPEGISSAEVYVQLRPAGVLHMRLEFEAGVNPNSSASIHSGDHHSRTLSIASPSRFSIRGRRPGHTEDE
ncbi:transmembrane protein [Phlegmacium glaucopus]|nr:transmembrane protein [Phlegmacium glaucopus]